MRYTHRRHGYPFKAELQVRHRIAVGYSNKHCRCAGWLIVSNMARHDTTPCGLTSRSDFRPPSFLPSHLFSLSIEGDEPRTKAQKPKPNVLSTVEDAHRPTLVFTSASYSCSCYVTDNMYASSSTTCHYTLASQYSTALLSFIPLMRDTKRLLLLLCHVKLMLSWVMSRLSSSRFPRETREESTQPTFERLCYAAVDNSQPADLQLLAYSVL